MVLLGQVPAWSPGRDDAATLDRAGRWIEGLGSRSLLAWVQLSELRRTPDAGPTCIGVSDQDLDLGEESDEPRARRSSAAGDAASEDRSSHSRTPGEAAIRRRASTVTVAQR